MTIIQLQYLVAVSSHRNFSKAAMECCVSQPALSMQIKQLEEELGIIIFDRSKSPLSITPLGQEVLNQAKKALHEFQKLGQIISADAEPSGEIILGIIPTLAPYLLPLFLKNYTTQYPKVKLIIKELTTTEIIDGLNNLKLDAALMATPLQHPDLVESPLFYERMLAYVSTDSPLFQMDYLRPPDIDPSELWLLEEGHCLRSQVIKLCELRNESGRTAPITFQAGSIETLMRLVDHYQGMTIVPELATLNLSTGATQKLRRFNRPVPTREISLVYHKFSSKLPIMRSLEGCILQELPTEIFEAEGSLLEIS